MSNYNQFAVEVRENHESFKTDDWAGKDEEFKNYVENCYLKYKSELSFGERIDFWKQTMSYSAYRGSQDLPNSLDLSIDLSSEFEELSSQGQQEIEDYLRTQVTPELEKAVDQIVKEVDQLGTKIKEWLNDE